MGQETKELYEFGPFQVDVSRRVVSRGGQPVLLTSKAFETLLLLVRNRERVLLKDEMMKVLWPDTFVEEVNLAQNVSALRKALGETPGENLYIATIPSKGYRFVGDVREGGDRQAELIVERRTTSQVIIQEEIDDGESASEGAPRPLVLPAPGSFPLARIGLLLVVMVLIAVAAYLWSSRRGAQAPRIQSIAVLPFRGLSSTEDDQHLGLGITDAVITRLSNIRQLSVRPTDVSLRYADPSVDVLRAAREMGVDSILSGKIQKSGDRIRLTVQLIRVRDNQPLWAQTFDGAFTGIFAVEDSISERIADTLTLNLAPQEKKELARHYTENLDAYRNYLQGRYAEFTFTRDGMKKAIEYFNRAIALDPGYALAYAGLADAYTTESDWLLSPRDAMPKAEAAARKALAFDDNLAEAHGALAHALLHEWKLEESGREFQRALALNPNNTSTLYAYSEYLASVGRVDEAIATSSRALKIDPLSPEINSFLAWDYYLKRDYERCIASSKQNQEMFPDFWVPHLTLGMCWVITGRYSDAIAEFRKAREQNPEATYPLAGIGISYARAGNRAEAIKTAESMQDLARRSYVSPIYIGMVYGALGDRDAEFSWFNKAYDDQSEYLLWLTLDPLFDGELADARFAELVKRMGLTKRNWVVLRGSARVRARRTPPAGG